MTRLPSPPSGGAGSRESASAAQAGRVLTAAFMLFVGVVLVGQLVSWVVTSGRGLDTTDEGYYLNVIAHPTSEVGTAMWFGAVLHGPWMLVGQSVAALRLFGMAVTLFLGALLAHEALQLLSGTMGARLPQGTRSAVVLGIGLSSLLVYAQVPPTPSYNTVALWALCLVSAGLLRWLRAPGGAPATTGSVLVGAGAGMIVLAKPTSALLLALVLLAAAVLRRAGWVVRVSIAAGSGLLTLALVLAVVRLSPTDFAERTRTGVVLTDLLGGHPHLIRWDDVHAPKAFVLMGVLLLFATVVPSLLLGGVQDRRGTALAIVAVGVTAAAVVAAPFLNVERARGLPYVMTIIWLVPGAAAVQVAIHLLRHRWNPRNNEHVAGLRDIVAGSCLLLVMPTIYAFGTNNNYWTAQARAAVFWVCAGIVAAGSLKASRPQAILPHVMSPLVLVVLMSSITLLAPYRTAPLGDETSRAAVGEPVTDLLLTPAARTSLTTLRSAFLAGGATSSTRVLDLTGDSPGYVWALGAVPAGQGWVIGGYPGSAAAASYLMKAMGCRAVASAWVLTSNQSVRSLGSQPLTAVGLDLQRHYEPVAEVQRPSVARGAAPAGYVKVELLRPTRPAPDVCQPAEGR